MKLRNKKTGEIVENFDGFTTFTNDWSSVKNLQYTSLAKLNDDWEDYKPAEPLIKDEKIRKAVRAWADALESEGNPVKCYGCGTWIGLRYERPSDTFTSKFEIDSPNSENDLELERFYTIAELCGEEEEWALIAK